MPIKSPPSAADPALLRQAAQALQSGRPDLALQALDRILGPQPRDLAALGLAAVALLRLGRPAEAEAALRRALQVSPGHGDSWFNLGQVLAAQGKIAEAAPAFGKAARLCKPPTDALVNQASALVRLGDAAQAQKLWAKALALAPDHRGAALGLASLHLRSGRAEQALQILTRPILAHTTDGGLLSLRAETRIALGQWDKALEDADAALAAGAPLAPVQVLRSAALIPLGRAEDALAALDLALTQSPALVAAHVNRALALRDLMRLDEAVEAVREACRLGGDSPGLRVKLGLALMEAGRLEEAEQALRPAGQPDPALDHNRGLALLHAGRFREGFALAGARFESGMGSPRRDFERPDWTGETGDGTRLLLWGEQGLGEEILYATMIPDLVAKGIPCALEASPRLVGLLRRSLPQVAVFARQDPPQPPPGFEATAQCATADLGRWLRPDPQAVPDHGALLRPDPSLVAEFRDRYRTLSGGRPVIGVSWRSRSSSYSRFKTSTLTDWAPLLRDRPALFVNLQYGDCTDELALARKTLGVDILADESVDPFGDMDRVAAQIAALDLVISVSNTTVHLAGALGVPCWVLLARGPGLLWYWLHDRTDSPWYRSLALLRQSRPGDWTDVVQAAARRLDHWLAPGNRGLGEQE